MADIRIKDLATTATTTASDDFMAVDGTTNGTRKLSAATPAFLTSVTTPSLTSPASTDLTLAAGSGNQNITLTPSGTGSIISSITGTAFYPSFAVGANTGLFFASASSLGFSTGGTERARFVGSTGDFLLSSTTAGSANAGARVVTGGLATGAATYIGGTLTTTSSTSGKWNTQIINTNSTNGYGLLVKGGVSGVSNIVAFQDYLGATQLLLSGAGNLTVSGTGTSTFAGAVAIANTVSSVSPTSPNRTITMVVGGVTLYIAAKTTND